MDGDLSIPFAQVPRDTLRNGLVTLKDDVLESHPVEKIQKHGQQWEGKGRYEAMRNLYGNALPARMHMERQILERNGRLPPFESSNISYEAYSGRLGEFTVESYLGLPEYSESVPADVHSQLEEKLGLNTNPTKRGFF